MFRFRNRERRLSEYRETSSPRNRYVPAVGLSMRPRMCSSVDFPQPDGPMIETNCPASSSSLTASSAVVSTRSVRKSFCRFSVSMIMGFPCDAIARVFSAPALHRLREHELVDLVERVVARRHDAVAGPKALEHLDEARILAAEPNRRATRGFTVLGHEIHPAARRLLKKAATSHHDGLRRLAEIQLHRQPLTAPQVRRNLAGKGHVDDEGVVDDFGEDLVDDDLVGLSVEREPTRRADLDARDVVLVDPDADLVVAEHVDLPDTLSAVDVLPEVGVDVRQVPRDRRARVEAVGHSIQELETQVQPIDRVIGLRRLLIPELCLARDALDEQIALRFEVSELLADRLERLARDGTAVLEPRVAIEGHLRIDDPMLEVEQLIAQQELALREADLRVAQRVQVLHERRLGVDRVPLHGRVREAQDQLACLHVLAALDEDLLDAAAFLDVEVHRRHGLDDRSEEHTSELQSQSNLVCRRLLEKKKKKKRNNTDKKKNKKKKKKEKEKEKKTQK